MRFMTCLFSLIFVWSCLPSQSMEVPSTTNEAIIEKPTLTLYYAPWCYYCHKVVNYLKRINKQVPLKDVQNPRNKEELIFLAGKRQVPCLFIDEEPLYESNAIIAWLSSHQDLLEDI